MSSELDEDRLFLERVLDSLYEFGKLYKLMLALLADLSSPVLYDTTVTERSGIFRFYLILYFNLTKCQTS